MLGWCSNVNSVSKSDDKKKKKRQGHAPLSNNSGDLGDGSEGENQQGED